MQNQLLTVSFQRVTDESLAPKTDLSQGEESRLSSDSSDKPFVFNKPVLRSCQRFNPSRPGRVVPLKAGCSQDWLPHKSEPHSHSSSYQPAFDSNSAFTASATSAAEPARSCSSLHCHWAR